MDPVIRQGIRCTVGVIAIIGLLLAAASVAGILVPRGWARQLIVQAWLTGRELPSELGVEGRAPPAARRLLDCAGLAPAR